ncbi:MAG: hypothetical protein CM1200mP3_14910 [Chloroflexota bacterium]|nr:MAG: hypothetical protein CM1200mP3_14910 [Chloroflexota bacterium]
MEGPFQLLESVIDTVVTRENTRLFFSFVASKKQKNMLTKRGFTWACSSWNFKAKTQTMAFFRLPCFFFLNMYKERMLYLIDSAGSGTIWEVPRVSLTMSNIRNQMKAKPPSVLVFF